MRVWGNFCRQRFVARGGRICGPHFVTRGSFLSCCCAKVQEHRLRRLCIAFEVQEHRLRCLCIAFEGRATLVFYSLACMHSCTFEAPRSF